MTDKTNIRRSVTKTTRSWTSVENLTPEQREQIDALLDDGVGVTQTLTQHGTGQDNFSAEISNGVVTVNGQRYDSIDAVPEEARRRIEMLRARMGEGSDLRKMLDESILAAQQAAEESTRAKVVAGAYTGMENGVSPGAVPRRKGVSRWLLIGVVIGVVWVVASWFKLT